jgi:hypothetical protein
MCYLSYSSELSGNLSTARSRAPAPSRGAKAAWRKERTLVAARTAQWPIRPGGTHSESGPAAQRGPAPAGSMSAKIGSFPLQAGCRRSDRMIWWDSPVVRPSRHLDKDRPRRQRFAVHRGLSASTANSGVRRADLARSGAWRLEVCPKSMPGGRRSVTVACLGAAVLPFWCSMNSAYDGQSRCR